MQIPRTGTPSLRAVLGFRLGTRAPFGLVSGDQNTEISGRWQQCRIMVWIS